MIGAVFSKMQNFIFALDGVGKTKRSRRNNDNYLDFDNSQT